MNLQHEKVDRIMSLIEIVMGITPRIHQYNCLYENIHNVIADIEEHYAAIIDDYISANEALMDEVKELKDALKSPSC